MGREMGIEIDSNRIRAEFTKQGYTLRTFTEKCGWEHPMVANTLRVGKCRPTTLNIMAQALGLPCSEFMKIPSVKVQLDYGAKLPTRAHELVAGYDLYATHDQVIPKGKSWVFDTGVHIQIPPGHCGLLVSKSGLHCKQGIQSTGLIDAGYTGTIKVKLTNHGSRVVTIKEYQKISQLVILPIITPDLEVVDHLEETERGNGGFGSSGKF
jgi:dUTP pyrophosphatase